MPPDLPGDIDPDLLDRYLAGECSEAETAVVRRYLMARPQAARALDRFLAALGDDAERPRAPDDSASWVALRERFDRGERGVVGRTTAPTLPVPRPRSTPWFAARTAARASAGPRWRTAARFAVAASLLVTATYLGTHRANPAVVSARPNAGARTYVTQPLERAELRLLDGTRVHLAPGSRLRVAADYGSERRDVFLEGEGYFDVVHDAGRPFTVFAGSAAVHDVGTAFAVRNYRADGAVRVTVRSGVVAMSGVGRLARGDVGRLVDDGRASVRHGADVDALLGWLHGTLVFDDAPLGQVIADLGRWYDVDVRLSDPALARLPFTGTLDEDAEPAMRLVAATLGLHVTHEGAHFELAATPGRTPRRRPTPAGPESP